MCLIKKSDSRWVSPIICVNSKLSRGELKMDFDGVAEWGRGAQSTQEVRITSPLVSHSSVFLLFCSRTLCLKRHMVVEPPFRLVLLNSRNAGEKRGVVSSYGGCVHNVKIVGHLCFFLSLGGRM